MSSLNQVVLIGNLGRDPEILKSTEQGDFVRLSLATTKRYRNKAGEVQKDTQWHTVYLNNGLGKIASTQLSKGVEVFISGELRTNEWQDKNGQTHHSTAVYARELKFLSMKLQKEGEDSSEIVEESDAYQKAKQEINKALGS